MGYQLAARSRFRLMMMHNPEGHRHLRRWPVSPTLEAGTQIRGHVGLLIHLLISLAIGQMGKETLYLTCGGETAIRQSV